MHLNFNHLLYFREIAISGSIAKASANLRISPPALSTQLKSFEDYLGKDLFLRDGKKLIITEFGKEILIFANKANSLSREVITFANNRSSIKHQIVKIAMIDGLPKILTKDIVKLIKDIDKDCVVEIFEGDQISLLQKLKLHEVDIVFTNKVVYDENDEIICQKFAASPLAIYGTSKFKGMTKNFPKSLDNKPMILPSLQSDIRISIDKWFIENHIHYLKVAEVQDSSVKKILAQENLGMIPLSDYSASELIKKKQLIKIGEVPNVVEEFYYSTKKNKNIKNKNIEALILKLKGDYF